jgi:hypothetical protein
MAQRSDSTSQRNQSATHRADAGAQRSAAATLFVVLGLAAVAAGAALCVGPHFSWKLEKITASVQRFGLEGGVIAMGGLVLFALGVVQRAVTAPQDDVSEDTLLVEQVAADLIQVRSSIEESTQTCESIRDDMRMLQSEVANLAQVQRQPVQVQATGGANEEGLFRLAASLDQLGARMEQRLKDQYAEMQQSLEGLNGVIDSVRKNMEDLMSSVAAPAETASHEPRPVAENGEAPVEDEVVQLGLLDSLDDPTAPEHSSAHASIAPETPPSAALPKARGDAARAGWEQAPAEPVIEEDKLAELQSLLSDERVRAALEQLRRAAQS